MANSIYLGGGIKSAFCGGNVKEIWQGENKLWGGDEPIETDAICFFDGIHKGIGAEPNKDPFNYLSYDTTSISGKKIPFLENSIINNVSGGGSVAEKYRLSVIYGICWSGDEIYNKLQSSNVITIEFWAKYISTGSDKSILPVIMFRNQYNYFNVKCAFSLKTSENSYTIIDNNNFPGSSGYYSGSVGGNWHHYVISWNDKTLNYFFDGNLIFTKQANNSLKNLIYDNFLISIPCRYTGYVTCGMTGIMVYDYAKYTENFTPSPIPQINA